MILAVCADKGSPGVTTLATALGVVWPVDRVVLEADPSGGDLAFRLRSPRGQFLDPNRSVLDVAADAREGLPPGALARYAEPTSLGAPVLKGRLSRSLISGGCSRAMRPARWRGRRRPCFW